MLNMLLQYMTTIAWLGLLIFFIIMEAATAQVVSIWFVAGALVSLILSLLKLPLAVQIAAFLITSLIFLAVLRPIVKKRLEPNHVATNADRVIGSAALVTTGAKAGFTARVIADRQDWAALCSEDLENGDTVIVKEINGVTLRVEKQ